jgi:hypothetical protein
MEATFVALHVEAAHGRHAINRFDDDLPRVHVPCTMIDPATSFADIRRSSTAESEYLLDQAAGFARGGDYLGAQARARFAEQRLITIAASLPANDAWAIATHAHLDLRIRYYDSLVRNWQEEVGARHATYVARERRAIGADVLPGPEPNGR